MAKRQSTDFLPQEQPNVDLIRRYCPSLSPETCDDLAALIPPNAQACWLWTGKLTPQGYGYFHGAPTPYGASTTIRTQRYMYEVFVADLPMDHLTHHQCQVKGCWNPMHLEAVTQKEHTARHKQLNHQ